MKQQFDYAGFKLFYWTVALCLLVILPIGLTGCETPSQGREDAQRHERALEYDRNQREISIAQAQAEAKVEVARLQAEEATAKAEAERARMDAQLGLAREQNAHREQMFILYSTTINAYLDKHTRSLPWLAALSGAITAIVVIYLLNRWLNRLGWLE